MKKLFLSLIPIALIVLVLPAQSISAADEPFPKIIFTPNGSQPEGFAIGKGTTAYNGSPDGSIFKFNLRTGQGEILVPAIDPEDCLKLGMRVDPRTNYLFVAGCIAGNAFVFDADSGALIMEYQLGEPGLSIINDLAITKDAVYFTDAMGPFIYRLPLSENGEIPLAPDAATAIRLPDEFAIDPETFCCGANGIVATPDGKTLIIGHSNLAMLYRMDLGSGDLDAISIDPPLLVGFLDGIAMKGRTLYIMTPFFELIPVDGIQVVNLDEGLLSGKRVGIITDPDLDGVASGALFGNSLYVNNARYLAPLGPDTPYFVTKLNRFAINSGDPSVVLRSTVNLQPTSKPGPEVAAGGHLQWSHAVTNFGTEKLRDVVILGRQKLPELGERVVLCVIGGIAPNETKACSRRDTAIDGRYKILLTMRARDDQGNDFQVLEQAFYTGSN